MHKLYFPLVIILLVTTLLLAACGLKFQDTKLPSKLNILYVQTNPPYSIFGKNLKLTLEQAGIHILGSPDKKHLILNITSNGPSAYAIGSANAFEVNIFNLNYTINYMLQSATGKTIFPLSSVTSTKTISLPPNTLIGNSILVKNTYELLELQAITQLINILSSKKTVDKLKQYQQQINHKAHTKKTLQPTNSAQR